MFKARLFSLVFLASLFLILPCSLCYIQYIGEHSIKSSPVIWNWESQFPAHPVASKDGHSSESGRKIKLQCLCF